VEAGVETELETRRCEIPTVEESLEKCRTQWVDRRQRTLTAEDYVQMVRRGQMAMVDVMNELMDIEEAHRFAVMMGQVIIGTCPEGFHPTPLRF
jgi:predicted ATPase